MTRQPAVSGSSYRLCGWGTKGRVWNYYDCDADRKVWRPGPQDLCRGLPLTMRELSKMGKHSKEVL